MARPILLMAFGQAREGQCHAPKPRKDGPAEIILSDQERPPGEATTQRKAVVTYVVPVRANPLRTNLADRSNINCYFSNRSGAEWRSGEAKKPVLDFYDHDRPFECC